MDGMVQGQVRGRSRKALVSQAGNGLKVAGSQPHTYAQKADSNSVVKAASLSRRIKNAKLVDINGVSAVKPAALSAKHVKDNRIETLRNSRVESMPDSFKPTPRAKHVTTSNGPVRGVINIKYVTIGFVAVAAGLFLLVMVLNGRPASVPVSVQAAIEADDPPAPFTVEDGPKQPAADTKVLGATTTPVVAPPTVSAKRSAAGTTPVSTPSPSSQAATTPTENLEVPPSTPQQSDTQQAGGSQQPVMDPDQNSSPTDQVNMPPSGAQPQNTQPPAGP